MKTNRKTSELQSRPEQRGTNRRKTVNPARPLLGGIDFAQRHTNRRLPTDSLIGLLRTEAPRFYEVAEVVGKWVWIGFAKQPSRAITRQLAQLGFHWNNTRQVWQHPCGLYRTEAAPFDPRQKYGSYFPADTQTN